MASCGFQGAIEWHDMFRHDEIGPAVNRLFAGHRAGALAANIVAFAVFAFIAFRRNADGLFFSFDGTYRLIDMSHQLDTRRPLLAFSNDFLQSIGNIQLLENARLLLFYWPLHWLSDVQLAKAAVYVAVALLAFIATYGLARLLTRDRLVALMAAWILGVLVTPMVPIPFFYPILNVAPSSVLIATMPLVAFALLLPAGRSGWLLDVFICVCFVGVGLYLLAANTLWMPLIVLGAIPYVALALLNVHDRAELFRKLGVLAVAGTIAVALQWPWYVLGVFSYSAAHVFPDDFTAVYRHQAYISILFHGFMFGWAGPGFVIAAFAGVVLSLWRRDRELRAPCYVLATILVAIGLMGAALMVLPRWILPPPLYFEITAWPLYAFFAAVTLRYAGTFVTARLRVIKLNVAFGASADWLLPVPAIVLAGVLVWSLPPTASGYPFPPQRTAIVDVLQPAIALGPDSEFRGRVATILPTKDVSADAWVQQYNIGSDLARTGNDKMSIGLWYYRIPTLFEYNEFITPAFHALTKRALQRPRVAHQRNITIYTHANTRVLQLLGVRFLITADPVTPVGETRATETIPPDHRIALSELASPNLGTYSPVTTEVQNDLATILDFVMNENVDLATSALVGKKIEEPLVPLRSSSISMVNEDIRIRASSPGQSLAVVPLEFSNCLSLDRQPGVTSSGKSPYLVRVNGLLTGVVFDRELDATLAFRTGPLHNAMCRWRDYQDFLAMLSPTRREAGVSP
jgi:hypothetical protein